MYFKQIRTTKIRTLYCGMILVFLENEIVKEGIISSVFCFPQLAPNSKQLSDNYIMR